ncbi:hypothetical protein GCM10022420_073510 [Streptomyces iranensis]
MAYERSDTERGAGRGSDGGGRGPDGVGGVRVVGASGGEPPPRPFPKRWGYAPSAPTGAPPPAPLLKRRRGWVMALRARPRSPNAGDAGCAELRPGLPILKRRRGRGCGTPPPASLPERRRGWVTGLRPRSSFL